MEIYSGNSDNQKNTTKEKRVFFKPSLLNFSIPIIEKWAFFLVGFIGIDIISLFFSFIVSISTKDSALQSSLLNFLTYLTLFLIFIAIIAFDKRKNYKKIFENFKNLTPLIYSIVALVVLIGFNFLTNYIVQSLFISVNSYGVKIGMNLSDDIMELPLKRIERLGSFDIYADASKVVFDFVDHVISCDEKE